ncbi:MAG: hypothetical protein BWY75_02162 [bacterium ADurb.Bin425]|nr:MAG: hypothetical protein BWY75_02162 [bacterium ADurb.Bin425]
MKNPEELSLNDEKKSSLEENSSINFLDITINDKFENKPLGKEILSTSSRHLLEPIDLTIPLDGSKSKALPEFIALTPESNKTGLDGAWSTIKDTVAGIFGERDTLHSHARALARAGMTEAERSQLFAEEQKVREYNENSGPGLWKTGFAVPPKTPMLDELDRRTVALEKSISQSAKNNMTPLEIAQLESGHASKAVEARYAANLIGVINQYESKGSVPTEIYQNIVKIAALQKAEEQKAMSRRPSQCEILPMLELSPGIDITYPNNRPALNTHPTDYIRRGSLR